MYFKDFFKEIEPSKYHTEKISENIFNSNESKNYDDIDNETLEEFNSLYKDCFCDLTDIDINDYEAHKEYSLYSIDDTIVRGNRESIAFDFLMKKYEYPNIQKDYFPIGLEKKPLEIDSGKVLDEIFTSMKHQRNIFLTGTVGDGKSTFLKRMCFDLRRNIKDIRTFPIYIDIQKEKILTYDQLISYIVEKIGFNKIVRRWDEEDTQIHQTDIEARLELRSGFLSFIKAVIGGRDKHTSIEKEREQIIKYEIIEDYVRVIKEFISNLNSFNCKVVFLIDNLDTLNYENERFMFFDNEAGFKTFCIKGQNAKYLVESFIRSFTGVSSCVFSLRPYVYSQIINSQEESNQQLFDNTIKFKILGSYPFEALKKRSALLNEICTKLSKEKNIPKGRKKNILKLLYYYNETFENMVKQEKRYRGVLEKFYDVATQGHRTIISYYHDISFYPATYNDFLTHDAILLYKLDFFKKYTQVLPKSCNPRVNNNSGKKYNFPNMFLVLNEAECNRVNEFACKPNRFTYWLKYLILFYINEKKNITIKKVLNLFTSENDNDYDLYDNHSVRLILGSLGTSNEDNCIKFHFQGVSDSITLFEEETEVNTTRFGKNIIEKKSSFSFFDLQFFAEDYLLPKPKIEDLLTEENISYIKKHSSELNYEYLLTGREDPFNMIVYKCKMCILFLYYLEFSFKYEKNKYFKVWEKIESEFPNNELFNKSFFKEKRHEIISEAKLVSSKNPEMIDNALNFLSKEEIQNIDRFFNKIYSNNLKIEIN